MQAKVNFLEAADLVNETIVQLLPHLDLYTSRTKNAKERIFHFIADSALFV